MKTRVLLIMMMIGMISGMNAQKENITLTFTAESNGQNLPLNSILIENLTQGGDTTLYSPDTTLVLEYVAGIGDDETIRSNVFSISQNYPNPIEGNSTISLYLPQNEDVWFTLCNIIGGDLIQQEYRLNRGNHYFTFFPGKERLYLLTVQVSGQSQTIKMFNSPNKAFGSGICKLEYNKQQTYSNEYKTGNIMNNFIFELDDELKFTASTTMGELTITSTLTGDETYTFQFIIPCSELVSVFDVDGNEYNTVQIGYQCWMKENLKTTTYRSGTPIPNVTDSLEWLETTTGAYIWYNNDMSWENMYGAIYNWYAAIDVNGLCPTGWHVPTEEDWTELSDFIGGTGYPYGNQLKSCRQVDSPLGEGCQTSEHPRWDIDTYNAYYGTDDYGFSGLPAGARRDGYVSFTLLGTEAMWWSSSQTEDGFAIGRTLRNSSSHLIGTGGGFSKNQGRSIRCLRN